MPGSLTCPLLHPRNFFRAGHPCPFTHSFLHLISPSPAWMEGTMAQRTIFGFEKQIYLPRSGFLKMIVK